MIRDRLAALSRAAASVAIGGVLVGAVLYAITYWLGWYWALAIVIAVVGGGVYCTAQLPRMWRPW